MKKLSVVGKVSLVLGIISVAAGIFLFIQDYKKASELMNLTLIISGVSLLVSASLYKKKEL